ncbi:MAG: hypothetical protein AAFQ64_13625 [Pseudomonadota bacterium]
MILPPYLRTRGLAALRLNRRTFETWQTAQINRWLTNAATQVDAFAPQSDQITQSGLTALPRMTRDGLVSNFAAYNRLSLSASAVLEMEADGSAPTGYHVGRSTGTTGGRPMPYIVSDAERSRWLGTILAKALPDVWRTRHRVAVILPRPSPLYDRAGAMVQVLSPKEGWQALRDAVTRIAPTVIVAPPRALLSLTDLGLTPRRVVLAAEVADQHDRNMITTAWPKARIGEIYMATEGLFAVSCDHGALHLCEDRTHVDLEPITNDLFEPVISDFSRHTQILARYRTGDVVRKATPCPCGSPHRPIAVLGRRRDLPVINGVHLPFDTLGRVIRDAAGSDYRLCQKGGFTLHLTLPPEANATAASQALADIAPDARIQTTITPLTLPTDTKLRRITRIV